MSSNENLPPSVLIKLMKEIRSLSESPIEGIRVSLPDDNLLNIQADIDGPVGTPFEGGIFKIKLSLPFDFPVSAPKGHFLTKIFHPNVSKTGEICVNTLKKDWKSTNGIKHILLVVRCLLIVPNPESALNEDAGKLLLDDYEDYAKRAALITKIHAKPKQTTQNTNTNTSITEIATASSTSSSVASSSSSEDSMAPTNLVESCESPNGSPVCVSKKLDGSEEVLTSISIDNNNNVTSSTVTGTSSSTATSPKKKSKVTTASTTASASAVTTEKTGLDKSKLAKKKSLKRL